MTDDPRVEAVARAMWIAQYTENYDEREEGTPDAWDNPNILERWRKEYRTLARAALSAADKSAWRPISEALELPEGTCVEAPIGIYGIITIVFHDGKQWREQNSNRVVSEQPKMFRHLPTPPQERG